MKAVQDRERVAIQMPAAMEGNLHSIRYFGKMLQQIFHSAIIWVNIRITNNNINNIRIIKYWCKFCVFKVDRMGLEISR